MQQGIVEKLAPKAGDVPATPGTPPATRTHEKRSGIGASGLEVE